jgi:hypothetical protein
MSEILPLRLSTTASSSVSSSRRSGTPARPGVVGFPLRASLGSMWRTTS